MKTVHIPDLPWEEQRSPSGKFHSFCRNLSLALGGVRNTGSWGGGHPFDLQIRRLPPGASVCPFHSHLAQWELFLVIAGAGSVRAGAETHPIATGEVFIHPPGEPHQLTNTGATDLEVLIIADNPPMDGCYYPDSDKWALRPPGKIFRMVPADYFDGEDDLPAAAGGTPAYKPAPPPAELPPAPFATRKLHPDTLPWEGWESPKKKFHGTSKELSIALGARRATPPGLGGHPFDLELSRLGPGECGCPFHSHTTQWELFHLLSGTAQVRAERETITGRAGDVFLHAPGEAHQIRNASATEELTFLLVADNPPADVFFYPDTGKWGLRPQGKFFQMTETPYWDGEE